MGALRACQVKAGSPGGHSAAQPATHASQPHCRSCWKLLESWIDGAKSLLDGPTGCVDQNASPAMKSCTAAHCAAQLLLCNEVGLYTGQRRSEDSG